MREHQVTVVNESGKDIGNLYADAGESDAAKEVLGTMTILNGSQTLVKLPAAASCTYTLTAEYQDGSREKKTGVDVCAAASVAFRDER